MEEPWDCFDVGLEPFEEATSQLDKAVDKLVNADSLLEGGHGAADLLEGIGAALHATEEVCVDGLAEKVVSDNLPADVGPVSEMVVGLVLETVEFAAEGSLSVAAPLLGAVGDAHEEIGQAGHNMLDAFDNIASGNIGEAAGELAEIVGLVPDLSRDVAEALVQSVAGAMGEVLEFGTEVGGILADAEFDPNHGVSEEGGMNDE